MKGIILAGGTGSRLYPMTYTVNKQLLPIYDKPMIYYPISTLMSAGIREMLIISGANELEKYKLLLGNGNKWGVRFEYAVQEKPEGLAQALIIGEEYLNGDACVMILGDNLFFSSNLHNKIKINTPTFEGATIFAYRVTDPERYGVVEFDENQKAISIEEKPIHPRSQFAVTGLYIFDKNAPKYAKTLKPSKRNELEITDLNMIYLKKGLLNVQILSRGTAWLDTGTPESLLDASDFVRIIESRQGMKVGCPEEIAFKLGFISREELIKLSQKYSKNNYGKYLLEISKTKIDSE